MLIPHLCLDKAKKFQQDFHSSGLDQKQSGFPLALKDHTENGTKSQN